MNLKKSGELALLLGLQAMLLLGSEVTLSAAPANTITDPEQTNADKPTGSVSGVVVDSSGATLPGVLLLLDEAEKRYTISQADGSFVFLSVPVGEYNLTAKYLGYEDYARAITVHEGDNLTITVSLKEAAFLTGELVVTGELAKGQAKALNIEKNNRNITNMVAADQIGRFPDANVGEALKRIPGITMQNDQGEARNIVIRGLASNLNSVTLNGGRIPSAEGDNRNVQMDLIPSEMISLIEVNKTLLPDMEADAIGGSVNLVTKTAPHHRTISGTLGGGYNVIRNSGTYKGSFAYGDRFLRDKLGMVLSLSYENKDYGSDNIEGTWDKADNGQVFMDKFEVRKYDVQRVRRSASLNLDYQFDDNNKVRLKTIYNWRDDRENRLRLRQKKIKPEIEDGQIVGYKGTIDRETKGGIDNNRNRNHRLEDQRVIDLALDGDHLIANFAELDWGASYSRASEARPHERYFNMQTKKAPITEDLSDGIYPKITYQDKELTDFEVNDITESNQETYEEEWRMKANVRIPMSVIPEQKGRLRIGGKVKLKDKDRDNIQYLYSYKGDAPTFDKIDQATWDKSNFLNGKGYVPGTFVSPAFLGGLDLNNGALFDREEQLEEFWTANYHAKENIYAGYLRWDQNISEKLLVIAGLRVEHTTIDYTGNTLMNDEKGPQNEGSNSYTNFFPNLTLRYAPVDKFVLRGAFSTSLARPNYYWLVPYVSISSKDMNIQTGNPDLKSTYAYNFDLIGTYYPGNIGQLSAGLFYKRMNDFIYTYATNDFTTDRFAREFPGIDNPIPAGEEWKYMTHRNGDNVDLYGVEISYNRQLDFIPSKFLQRFSIYANYTYTHSIAKGITNGDGEEREEMSLPGSAPHMLNASLAYEDSKFTARLSLNYAAAYVDELGADAFEDRFYGDQTFLDFNASYKILPSLQIYFEGNNLLNTPLYYYQGQSDRLMQIEYYKPVFSAGLKWNL